MSDNQNKPMAVFISYSWDSDKHKEWVKKLADRLTEEGLDVILDQYQPAGTPLTRFMANGLEKADRVLIIGTPDYKKKAETKGTGAAFEEQIIKVDMMDDLDTTKFIPILRKGSFPASFTKLIKERIGFDFSKNSKFESEFIKLVDELFGKTKRPEKKDEIQRSISLQEEYSKAVKIVRYMEDRRPLYTPFWIESPYDCKHSIDLIRAYLTDSMGNISSDAKLFKFMKDMRFACRGFLNKCETLNLRKMRKYGFGTPYDHDSQDPKNQIIEKQEIEFYNALEELRNTFGIILAEISKAYGIDIEDDLASILPP